MSGWTQPIPVSHWHRNRESLSFVVQPFLDPAPPVDVVFRAPLKAPQFAPYRMPQSWVQTTPLSLTQTNIQFRAPMQVPTHGHRHLANWRPAWNPPNLMLLHAANPPTLRYHPIGCFMVIA